MVQTGSLKPAKKGDSMGIDLRTNGPFRGGVAAFSPIDIPTPFFYGNPSSQVFNSSSDVKFNNLVPGGGARSLTVASGSGWGQGSINGITVLDTESTVNDVGVASGQTISSNQQTSIIVYKFNSTTAGQYLLSTADISPLSILLRINSSKFSHNYGSNTSIGTVDTDVHMSTSFVDRVTGANSFLKVSDEGTITGTVGSNDHVWGFLGQYVGVAQAADCLVAEIMIWERALTAGEQTQIETYVNSTYGVVL